MSAFVDLIGRRFGRLVVIARSGSNGDGRATWRCQCDCGGEPTVLGKQLLRGTRSCGCLRDEVARTGHLSHGDSLGRPPEYTAWSNMIQRCENPANTDFALYGARGIGVCTKWRVSYAAFLADVGRRPSPDHTIDRIDNYRGYEPGNVRWATHVDQANNKRNNRSVTYLGEAMTLRAAIVAAGDVVSYTTVHTRMERGWPLTDALETRPLKAAGKRPKGSRHFQK